MSGIGQANAEVARALVEEFARSGLRECCVAPGSRSTPLVLALADQPAIRIWTITDERAGAFFALGMARTSGRPVAVLCTSGTAAANLLPAAVEAALSEVPLLLLTADRPPELRDCRAAQTIDQVGIYGSHVRWSVDLPAPAPGLELDPYYRTVACRAMAVARMPPAGPVHINAPFREPLLPETSHQRPAETHGRNGGVPWTVVHDMAVACDPSVVAAVEAHCNEERGIIVCGSGVARDDDEAATVAALAQRLGWPMLADPLSGLRYGDHDKSNVVDSYDVLLRSLRFRETHRPSVVVRLGGLPASKTLTAFLTELRGTRQIAVASPGIWPDPIHAISELVHADPRALCRELMAVGKPANRTSWLESWSHANALVRDAIATALVTKDEPFEGAVPGALLGCLPAGSLVHVGNSMPVRDIDMFTGVLDQRLDVTANRGANGIDGVLSTALGAAAVGNSRVALLVGDLSFLHDLGGLQIAARHGLDLLVVLVNNDGGGIFSFLPQAGLGERFERLFATPHGLELEPAVRMCGGQWRRVVSQRDLTGVLAQTVVERGLRVIEVPSDRARNVERHREIIGAALEALEAQREAAA